jgi:uncharacterized membrane protein
VEAHFIEWNVLEWLNLLGRWLHLIAGIAWIGASFYFVWLDNHLLPPQDENLRNKGVSGELWAVHGGGFYNAQKYTVAPPALPPTLHWFKWEAYITWLSGMFMLCVVYYAGADVYLIDRSVRDFSPAAAIATGLGFLFGGWIIYDRLCASPLGSRPQVLSAIIAALLACAAYGLCQVFSGRGAFIHFGAMLGTIMVANVFFVIIPGQRDLVRAKEAGCMPDPAHGLRAKQRSVHNTYFTLPVLFTMISNHYAMTYGSKYNWLVLVAISLAGAAIRTWFVARHKQHVSGSPSPLSLIIAAVLLGGVAFALVPAPAKAPAGNATEQKTESSNDKNAGFTHVQAIITQRCTTCHSATPTQPGFTSPPAGVMLDSPEHIVAKAQQMRLQLANKTMPIGNLTQMTEDERAAVISWIDRGASP